MIFILLTSTVIAAFELKCPNDLDRTFRTKHVCKNTTEVDRYSCLLDQDTNVYTESCANRADYVRPGQKYVTNGGRKNTDCSPLKYQPFKFWSNRLSQCVFKKSMCGDLGQILNGNGSSMVDSTCRCDYTAGYAFVVEPRNKCFCRPTEEDCMCFIVPCPTNMALNQDYKCSSRDDLSMLFSCQLIIKNVESKQPTVIKGEEKILTRNVWAKISVTCLSLLAIILLMILAIIELRHFPIIDKKIECQTESHKDKTTPEEAVKRLRSIIELLEQLLSNKEFDKDFQEELSAACPNYINVLQTYKRDLLRNDCGIIIAGETSAGKTSLINELVGNNAFYTSNLAATGTVCRIRNSESMSIKTYTKEECLLEEKNAKTLKALKSLIRRYTDVERNPPEIIDVYLRAPILRGNVIMVDTPGIGENTNLDSILLDFLPHAVSFVFIVNAKNAGGIHEDRLLRILKTVLEKRKEMPCFEPDEVIFLTNQWDIIKNTKEDGDEEDQHTKTWSKIQSKLEEGWPGFRNDRLFKISLKQVGNGQKTSYTKQFRQFRAMLERTIDKNKNKRVEYYFRFVQRFAVNAAMGISSRIHLLEIADDDRRESILKNKETVMQLEAVSRKKMMEAKEYKTEVIAKLAAKLSRYLHSDTGKNDMLNPPGKRNINSVPLHQFQDEIYTRLNMGINRWFKGEDVQSVIEEVESKMKNILSDVQSMMLNIEEDITGFTRSIHDLSFSVWNQSALRLICVSNGLSFYELIKFPYHQYKKLTERKAITIYKAWLSSFTDVKIRSCFEENFGSEYDKVIARIFEDEIPQKIGGYKHTIDNLLCEMFDNKQKNKSFVQLNGLVHDINAQIENFKKVAQVE